MELFVVFTVSMYASIIGQYEAKALYISCDIPELQGRVYKVNIFKIKS